MIVSTLPLLRSVCPDFLRNFAFGSKAENSLYPALCSREVLEAASYFVLADMIEECDPRPRSADRRTAERRELAFIGPLREDLKRGRYRPGEVLRVVRGPFDHPHRMFSFTKDRIVHTALFLVLEAVLAEGLEDCEGNANMLAALRATVRRGSRDFDEFDFEASADVSDGPSYRSLLRLIVSHVHDDEVRSLFKSFLKAPVVDVQEWEWETA